jgi:malate dehydrogenase
MLDQNRIFPCAVLLEGEYDINDIFLGVPVKLGHGGIKEIIEVDLDESENELLRASEKAVRSTLEDFKKLMDK